MEFNEKLQNLRKQKGLTQEELAEALYVSRTAISKWESGRGYPNIDSLKMIASYFSITIDELLTGSEVLNLAEQENLEKKQNLHCLLFGLLDISVALLLVLPLFGQISGGTVLAVSLLSLTEISVWLKIVYLLFAIFSVLFGILMLLLQNCSSKLWKSCNSKISLILNSIGVLLFIIGSHVYAATLLFIFLIIKVFILTKKA